MKAVVKVLKFKHLITPLGRVLHPEGSERVYIYTVW
jgi:hypothetical protein